MHTDSVDVASLWCHCEHAMNFHKFVRWRSQRQKDDRHTHTGQSIGLDNHLLRISRVREALFHAAQMMLAVFVKRGLGLANRASVSNQQRDSKFNIVKEIFRRGGDLLHRQTRAKIAR